MIHLFHKHTSMTTQLETKLTIPKKQPLHNAKVLFSEDSLMAKKAFLNLLFCLFSKDKSEQAQWEKEHITWTPKGREAIALFQESIREKKTFDLVILDNQLTDEIKGQQVATKLRRLGYKGPLLMLTSADPRELQAPQPTHKDGAVALAITTAIKSSEHYEFQPLENDAQSASEVTYFPAYFLGKPCKKDLLRHLLAEHFELTIKPRTDSIDEHPIRSVLNTYIQDAKEAETGVLIENTCLENLEKFKQFLLTSLSAPSIMQPPIHIDYGNITRKNPERHMIACALELLMRTIPETNDPAFSEHP
jgi:CheY-like chemotaxis protein